MTWRSRSIRATCSGRIDGGARSSRSSARLRNDGRTCHYEEPQATWQSSTACLPPRLRPRPALPLDRHGLRPRDDEVWAPGNCPVIARRRSRRGNPEAAYPFPTRGAHCPTLQLDRHGLRPRDDEVWAPGNCPVIARRRSRRGNPETAYPFPTWGAHCPTLQLDRHGLRPRDDEVWAPGNCPVIARRQSRRGNPAPTAR